MVMRPDSVKAVLVSVVLLATAGCGSIFGDQGIFRDSSEDY